ncbi:MAG: adenylyl-sulfate kinase [Myxococcales bacterium]|nr:adenylyl-sulfate kinase [Myxococcales bacterium]MDP3503524.1 adenylyl-sulfate kinase [Myxococcales bacterium]
MAQQEQQGFTVWLTGMLGAGKTTLAEYIAARLRQVGRKVEVLDEDDLGESLWGEIEGANKEERVVISRRLGVVADLLTRNGVCTLVACASPYKAVRDENRRLIQRYVEVYVNCPTEDLIKRDSSGKYKKALAGEIPNFVGITEPYEPPPVNGVEVTIQSNLEPVEAGGLRIFQALLDLTYMNAEELKIITGTKMKVSPKVKKIKPGKAPKAGKAAKAPKAAKKADKKKKK